MAKAKKKKSKAFSTEDFLQCLADRAAVIFKKEAIVELMRGKKVLVRKTAKCPKTRKK